MIVVAFILIAVIPYGMQKLAQRVQPFRFLGATISCYLAGVILGNGLSAIVDFKAVSQTVMEVSAVLGIALMLLSTDLKKWIKVSFKTLLSFGLGIVSVVSMAFIAFFQNGDELSEPDRITAYLTGTYIGGTPNMTAIDFALGSNPELYRQVFLSDVANSAVYLIFMMVFAKWFLGVFLPPYQSVSETSEAMPEIQWGQIRMMQKLRALLFGFLIAIAVVGSVIGVGIAIYGEVPKIPMTFVMLGITAVGVGLSFITAVRNLPGTYESGDYLFCMFFMAMGTMTQVDELIALNSNLLLYNGLILFGSLTMHILLAKLFKIDRDTLMVTSAAGIMSPPFIPSITAVLKNKEILVPGLTTAIIGLAAGNIIGISLAHYLATFLR